METIRPDFSEKGSGYLTVAACTSCCASSSIRRSKNLSLPPFFISLLLFLLSVFSVVKTLECSIECSIYFLQLYLMNQFSRDPPTAVDLCVDYMLQVAAGSIFTNQMRKSALYYMCLINRALLKKYLQNTSFWLFDHCLTEFYNQIHSGLFVGLLQMGSSWPTPVAPYVIVLPFVRQSAI